MLDVITLEGYKGFKQTTAVELSNITVLFGYNNSGKSALVRALPLLADSFKTKSQKTYVDTFLDYTSKSLRGGVFQNILNDDSNRLNIKLQWSEGFSLSFDLNQNALDDETIRSLKISSPERDTEYYRTPESPVVFESAEDESREMREFSEIWDPNIKSLINEMSKSVFWLSSLRTTPPRNFEIGVGIPIGIEHDGGGIGETLWYLNNKHSASFKLINDALFEVTGRRLSINHQSMSSSSTAGRQRVQLSTEQSSSSNAEVGIIDSGEGLAQVLPVIALCSMGANSLLAERPIIAIEQPELHLHPKAIVKLANFIVRCSSLNKNLKIVIETHSESFLIAIQKALVSKELSSDELSCYWVEKLEDQSSLVKVDIDEKGYLGSSWPDEVFREVLGQSRDLIKARREETADDTST